MGSVLFAPDCPGLLSAASDTLARAADCCLAAAAPIVGSPLDQRAGPNETAISSFYENLRFELMFLGYQLRVLYDQGRKPEGCIDKLEKISRMLNQLICSDTLDSIAAAFEGQVALPSFENLWHPDYSNLQKLQTYLAAAPSSAQLLRGNPRLFRSDYPDKKRFKLMKRLKKCNEKIEKLIPDASHSEPNHTGQPVLLDRRSFQGAHSIRQLACKLHSLLHRHWPCTCNDSHEAKLGASWEAKLQLGPNWNSNGTDPIEFDLLLYGPDVLQECRICVVAQEPHPERVIKACQVVNAEAQSTCLNLVVDESGTIWDQAPSFPSKLAVSTSSLEEITLKDLIEQAVEFTLMGKRILAVILANSLLHLYESPWLSRLWSKEHISFFQGENITPNLRRPFLSTRFGERLPLNEGPQQSRHMLHQFPSILALGIVLSEIDLGDRLATIHNTPQFQAYLNNPNPNTDLSMAQDLLNECKKRSYPGYTKPIEYCLDRNFLNEYARSATSYDNPEFLEAIYINIVYPLEQELLSGSSMTKEDLDKLLSDDPADSICNLAPHTNAPITSAHSSFQSQAFQFSTEGLSSMDLLPTIQEENMPIRIKHESTGEADNGVKDCVFDSGAVMCTSGNAIEWADHWFRDFKPVETLLASARKYPLTRTDKAKMVKIAVLDTGIDLTHPLLKDYVAAGRIPKWWDFVNDSDSIIDGNGHGTHTAHLLLKTASNAKICVARTFRSTEADDNTASLVAKAIYDAVDKWEVDIISMSFAFSEERDEIQKAIEYASYKGTLMFAAASNNKANLLNPIGYPARVKEHVICVNSSSGQDAKSTFSPHGQLGRENFSTVGEAVKAAWPLALNNGEEQRRQSGTSCATPIAAGVAAVVLEYSRQKAFPTIRHAERLKRISGMKKVLFDCMTVRNRDSTYNYVKPWLLLGACDPHTISVKISEALADIHS